MLRHEMVPRGLVENVQFRRELLSKCEGSEVFRREYVEACKKDVLFWVNTALWTYDPRLIGEGESPSIPWVTWKFQDAALGEMDGSLGKRDIVIRKSRDMGATWLCLALFLHRWEFWRWQAFMVLSRNEDLVDSPGNPDSLFWKMQFMLQSQPKWLTPRYTKTSLNLRNLDLESYIDGASTTSDAGRGGRRTAVLLDEYAAWKPESAYEVNAATANNTNCRIMNSTYKGATGAYYDQTKRSDAVQISMPWWDHPVHAEGLELVNGKKTSPWYRSKSAALINRALIAAELDMNPAGSAFQFFPEETLEELAAGCTAPTECGTLVHDSDGNWSQWLRFDGDQWETRLWFTPRNGRPPEGEYALGVDVSWGAGFTPSTISVLDVRTREKVCEVATARKTPQRFAEMAVAMARWFHGAYMIWESNGPGGQFGSRVVELEYLNVYFRRDEVGLSRTETDKPGWHSDPDTKDQLLSAYLGSLTNGLFVNRSSRALEECKLYVVDVDGHIKNPRARENRIKDPSGAAASHADIVVSDALAAKGGRDVFPEDASKAVEDKPPIGSFQWRMQQHRSLAGSSNGWTTPSSLRW